MKALGFVALWLFLTIGGTIGIRAVSKGQSKDPASPKPASILQRTLKGAEYLGATIVGGIVAAAAVYQAWGPFWPTPPTIEPRNPVDGSLMILPFTIHNRSFVFPIRSVTLSCYVNLLFVEDSTKHTILFRDGMVPGGTTLLPGDISYPCDARLISVQNDGTLVLGFLGGQNLNRPGTPFRPPLTVLKLCVAVIGSYVDWMGKGRPIEPKMFQWPASPGAREWAKAPVMFDLDEARWIPFDSTTGAAYAVRSLYSVDPDGTHHLRPGALTCDEATDTPAVINFYANPTPPP